MSGSTKVRSSSMSSLQQMPSGPKAVVHLGADGVWTGGAVLSIGHTGGLTEAFGRDGRG